jgi:D-3-phosphoglycerate dehydrogenase
MSSSFTVWFERQPPPVYARLLDGIGEIVGPSTQGESNQLADIGDADAIIASSRLLYDGATMDRAPRLRVISRTGIGLDNISVDDATARAIAVCNVPDGPTTSAAEHTYTLLFAVAKRLKPAERALREGRTDYFNAYEGIELNGLTLGLVGLGQIGSRVAQFGRVLGMNVTAYDPFVDAATFSSLGVRRQESLAALLGEADVVSLHAPLTPETRQLIDAVRLHQMKPRAILINTARGSLVDEQALFEALEEGHLAGAGLDVFDPEPPAGTNVLLGRDDVVATPHVASATGASKDRLCRSAIAQALQVLRGERPQHLVNAAVWPPPDDSRIH